MNINISIKYQAHHRINNQSKCNEFNNNFWVSKFFSRNSFLIFYSVQSNLICQFELQQSKHIMSIEEADRPLIASQLIVSEQELINEVLTYYKNLRSDCVPALTSSIPQQFMRIQKQIIGVVELRKNMQKTYQIDALQSQHFYTVAKLVEQKIELQRTITQMAEQLKSIQKQNMGDYIAYLRQIRQNTKLGDRSLFEKGHRILLELSNLRRTFSVKDYNTLESLSIRDSDDLKPYQITSWPGKQQDQSIFQSQNEKWELSKFIYKVKFKQLALREELIEERQRVHLEFERSNTQLIDILLREKQRDRNLRQKDIQKFGQIIKQRNEIEIQYENLNHSQKCLLPLIQAELLKLKGKLKEQESRHDIENQQSQMKCDQLQKQLRKVISISNRKEQNMKNKQKQSQLQLRSKLEKYSELQASLKEIQTKQNELNELLQLQTSKSYKFSLQIQQLHSRNQSLQSQLNQMILKSSQLSHIKAELSSKLDKAGKKIEQLQKNVQELRQQNRIEQAQIEILKHQKVKITAQIQDIIQQNRFLKEQIYHKNISLDNYQHKQKMYLKKIKQVEEFLERQSNQYLVQRNTLLAEIQQKNNYILALQAQIQASKQQKKVTMIESEMYQGLSQQIISELKRGQRQKTKIIDEFVKKINFFVVN